MVHTTRLRSLRRFHHGDFDPAELVDAKNGRRISVCLPARNEAETVGRIVEVIRTELVDDLPLVDELLVVDDHSSDATAVVAAAAGATVISAASVLPAYGPGHGKGEVLWKSVYASTGDLIVWCDADIRDFGARFILGVAGPLVMYPNIGFVKGCYARPLDGDAGGGRVTELVARPLLSMFHPHLAQVSQPLSGEFGGRRDLLERVPFVQGYGVDVALLIDAVSQLGIEGIAEVDLDVRRHRNRPLDELSPQATAVALAILRRTNPALVETMVELHRPGGDSQLVDGSERPPLAEIADYLSRSA